MTLSSTSMAVCAANTLVSTQASSKALYRHKDGESVISKDEKRLQIQNLLRLKRHTLLLCHILTSVTSLALISLSLSLHRRDKVNIKTVSVIIPVTSTAASQKVKERLKKQLSCVVLKWAGVDIQSLRSFTHISVILLLFKAECVLKKDRLRMRRSPRDDSPRL